MKLLLITASSDEIRQIRKTRVINFQQVTMPYLAALTLPNWEVEHIDEGQEKIDFNKEVDLVGITFHTPSANYVYELSKSTAGLWWTLPLNLSYYFSYKLYGEKISNI